MQCAICRITGLVGPDVIVTGSGTWVHHGECHTKLIKRGETDDRLPLSTTMDRRISSRHETFISDGTWNLFAAADDGVED